MIKLTSLTFTDDHFYSAATVYASFPVKESGFSQRCFVGEEIKLYFLAVNSNLTINSLSVY